MKTFSHGQSNPTYVLTCVQTGERLVLRRRPDGALLKGAHDVQREFFIQRALGEHGSGFPVPRVYAYEEDSSFVGSSFYVMEFCEGVVYRSARIMDDDDGVSSGRRRGTQSIETRRRIRYKVYTQLVETLARLHTIRIDTLQSLPASFAKSTGKYCLRVLNRWSRNTLASVKASNGTRPAPQSVLTLEAMLRELEKTVIDEQSAPQCVVHGDFRVDNVVFDAETHSIKAVLDWELSTLGDGLTDLATLCGAYHIPSDSFSAEAREALSAMTLGSKPPGVPSEEDLVRAYCVAAGNRSMPSPLVWAFYIGLSLFRTCGIAHGVGTRAMLGNEAAPNAAAVGELGAIDAVARRAVGLITAAREGPSRGLVSPGSPGRVNEREQFVVKLKRRVEDFVANEVLPAARTMDAWFAAGGHTERGGGHGKWQEHPLQEDLRQRARELGIWNLWVSSELRSVVLCRARSMQLTREDGVVSIESLLGVGLTNAEFARVAEATGWSLSWAPDAMNTAAPDTGNIETLARFGTAEHYRNYLIPLLSGTMRSSFLMTEPEVASSDATNICATLRPANEPHQELVLSGRKWWSSGAMNPRCKVCLVLCRDARCESSSSSSSNQTHARHSIAVVPIEHVKIVRALDVFGYDDAPFGHAEVVLEDVPVAVHDVLGSRPGEGFMQAQTRLGPGRLHHCVRLVGAAEHLMTLAAARVKKRHTFGKMLAENDVTRQRLGECRMLITSARLCVHHAATEVDARGSKAARQSLAVMKVFVPRSVQHIADIVIQLFGGGGLSSDFPIAAIFAACRVLRIADGPDEVHLHSLGKMELSSSNPIASLSRL